jgi:uncharacterized protein (DUF58 family)
MSVIPTTELFDAEFLAALQRLHIHARRVARGGRHAEQRSRDLGTGIEFRDFRPYVAGDDFRSIDWTIYRRLGKVFLRLFEEFEDLPVYLLPDISSSMYLETPPRAVAGLRTSLALASIALNQHDSVGLFPFGADLSVGLRPQSGKGRLTRFATSMAALAPAGTTNLDRSLRTLQALGLREGLAVVVSDFFDPSGIAGVLAALKRVRHRLLLVQLVRPIDRDPSLDGALHMGDLQLRDCESGAIEEVSLTPAVLARYRDAYDGFQEQLTGFANQRGIGMLQMDVEQDVLVQLGTLFEGGSMKV